MPIRRFSLISSETLEQWLRKDYFVFCAIKGVAVFSKLVLNDYLELNTFFKISDGYVAGDNLERNIIICIQIVKR